MVVKVITVAPGKLRQHVLSLPEILTITVTREDGYAASPADIYAAMTIALDGMTPKKTSKTRPRLTKRL